MSEIAPSQQTQERIDEKEDMSENATSVLTALIAFHVEIHRCSTHRAVLHSSSMFLTRALTFNEPCTLSQSPLEKGQETRYFKY